MGEKVDFHLLVEDKDDDEEASLPVLLPLLLPDFLPSGGERKKNKQTHSSHHLAERQRMMRIIS